MFELCEATLQSIAQAFASGELTSLELTLRYLERIADIDREGPALNSVLEINPDAVDIAEALDREYAQKGPCGPLHGVPVLIKDNINTRDKMHTSAGSLALADNYAAFDAAYCDPSAGSGSRHSGQSQPDRACQFPDPGDAQRLQLARGRSAQSLRQGS